MSHDIDEDAGTANLMLANSAWHRLGTVVGKAFSWLDALAADLDITKRVEKVAISDLVIGYEAPADEYAAVRNGRVLHTGLGEQWTPYQVEDAYALGQCIRESANDDGIPADLLSLGALDHGRKWFMTYDLGSFTIGDYDIADYLSINGSFDSSWVLGVLTSPVIEVCANTVACAKAAGITHYRFKHTSGIVNRVEAAKAALQQHRANRNAFVELGEGLLNTEVSKAAYSRLVKALFPVDDEVPVKTRNANEVAAQKVTEAYKGLTGMVSETGNGFAVVQAVNTYENWGTPVRRTSGRSEAETRAWRQIEAVVDGKQPLTTKAIELVGALN